MIEIADVGIEGEFAGEIELLHAGSITKAGRPRHTLSRTPILPR
jgi:hypothetical protein